MKNLFALTFLIFTAISVHAEHESDSMIIGEARWEEYKSLPLPSPLTNEGFKMLAVQHALDKCFINGHHLCAFKSSEITSCDHVEDCGKARAILQPIDHLSFLASKIYSVQIQEELEDPWDVLESLGIEAKAMNQALQECKNEGNHFCVILNTHNRHWSRYDFRAKALIKGFKIQSP